MLEPSSPGYRLVGVEPIQRRAIRNGVVAAVLTAAVLFAFQAAEGGSERRAAPSPTPSPSPSPVCTASWEFLPSPDPDPAGNQLLGVEAVSQRNVWGVGAFGPPDAPTSTLVERWDGRRWTIVPTPNEGTENALNAVAAIGPVNAWAVGWTSSGAEQQPLIEHWDGTAWSLVQPPSVTGGAVLNGVAMVGPAVWAVGASGSADLGTQQALALRWDGTAWATEPLPPLPGQTVLRSVAVLGPHDLLVVGSAGTRPLTLRFTGGQWFRVPTGGQGAMVDVAPGETGTAWAAGSSILRWTGSGWTAAGAVRRAGTLAAIAPVSQTDVWAVGSSPAGISGATRALLQHFDGKAWVAVKGQAAPGSETLTAASASPDGTVWAVGYRDTVLGRATLVVRGSVSCA
jgi:hypothetical protein